MHFSKVAGVSVALVAAAYASNEVPLAPCSPTTVFITTTFSTTATVTETVTAPAPSWWPSPYIASTIDTSAPTWSPSSSVALADDTPISTWWSAVSAGGDAGSTPPSQVTGTSTVYFTHTFAVTVTEPVTPIQTTSDQGPYYFSVVNGSTAWAGGQTPPATDSLVLATTVISIEPIPSTSALSTLAVSSYNAVIYPSSLPSTSTPTPSNIAVSSNSAVWYPNTSMITLTNISTELVTSTIAWPSTIASPASASSYPTAFAGIGSLGWNASASTNNGAITGPSANIFPGWATYATGASSVTAAADPPVSSSASKPELKVRRDLGVNQIRQVGAIVIATIDGQIVSWTNLWDGITTITTTTPGRSTSNIPTPVGPAKSSTTTDLEPATLSLSEWKQPSPTWSSLPSKSWTTMAISTSTLATPSWTLTSTSVSQSWTTHRIASSVSWSSLYKNATATSASASPTHSCAYSSLSPSDRFEINFDDLPKFSAPPNSTDYPPLFSPYHHLYWANGFSYVPPPEDPFPPISPPQLAVFIVNSTANVHSVTTGNISADGEGVGEFGAGPSFRESAFWIDAYSLYIGCDNIGPAQCQVTVNGYKYEPNFDNVVLGALQNFYQDPCPGLKNCSLKQIVLNEEFRNLTGLQIVATVGTEPVTWYADNIYVGWSNNSCAAIEERQVIAPDAA